MKIVNLYIGDCFFINEILKELSIHNIPFVYIKDSNELHFGSKIYRFYIRNLPKEDYCDEHPKLTDDILNNHYQSNVQINRNLPKYKIQDVRKNNRVVKQVLKRSK